MLKNSKDPTKDQKIATYEEKKKQELDELLTEYNNKKKIGLTEIKDKFNQLSKQVRIDAKAVSEALKRSVAASATMQQNGNFTVTERIQRDDELAMAFSSQAAQKRTGMQENQVTSDLANVNYGLDALEEPGYKNNHRESTGYIGDRK